jgi:hypothetical protein
VKLPHADRVRVDREKITEYLLSSTHPDGSDKAEFFTRFGFRFENWEVLQEALKKHGARHQVIKTVESGYGTRYAIDGQLESPDGRNPLVRTVWMIETGSTTPRLITAHPIR